MYPRFEESADAEFEFQLAEHLHKTVGEIREMDNDEFVRWNVYLRRKKQIEELELQKGR